MYGWCKIHAQAVIHRCFPEGGDSRLLLGALAGEAAGLLMSFSSWLTDEVARSARMCMCSIVIMHMSMRVCIYGLTHTPFSREQLRAKLHYYYWVSLADWQSHAVISHDVHMLYADHARARGTDAQANTYAHKEWTRFARSLLVIIYDSKVCPIALTKYFCHNYNDILVYYR